MRQLVKRIQSIRSKERIKHRGAGEKKILEIEKEEEERDVNRYRTKIDIEIKERIIR